MEIKTVVVGELEENCYILEKDGCVLVIDPGADLNRIVAAIGEKKVLKVCITHQHFDHIGALYGIMDLYKVGKIDFHNLKEQVYQIGPFTFQVIFTPGHSSDSVCYYFEKENNMFVGDFIFCGSIGRCDLPTGDFQVMQKSISKIKVYSNDIVLYPGHGNITTLGEEKRRNPYF